MASERIPLLDHLSSKSRSRSRSKPHIEYQTFFGDKLPPLFPSCTTFITQSLSKALSGSRTFRNNCISSVHFSKKRSDNVSTTYAHVSRGICFDNPVFAGSNGMPLSELKWLTLPIQTALENSPLPPFSVQANPYVLEPVCLTVHSCQDGRTQVTGQTQISFRSRGADKPSVAVFRDITIKRAGKYVVEVRSVCHPEFSILTSRPLTIEPKVETETYRFSGQRMFSEEMGRMSMWDCKY